MKVYGARIMEFSGLERFDAVRELLNLRRQLLIYVRRSFVKISNFLSALSSIQGRTCYKVTEDARKILKESEFSFFSLTHTHKKQNSLALVIPRRSFPHNVIPSVVFLALTWMAAKIKRRFPQEYNRESSLWNLCGWSLFSRLIIVSAFCHCVDKMDLN